MADDEVRIAERAWRASGGRADEARWLAARLRAGEVSAARLGAAAWAGHAAARDVVGGEADDTAGAVDPLAGLLALASPARVLALAAVVDAVWRGVEGAEVWPQMPALLAALRAWGEAPSDARRRAVGDATIAAERAVRRGSPRTVGLLVQAGASLGREVLGGAPGDGAVVLLEGLAVDAATIRVEAGRALRALDPAAPDPPPLPTLDRLRRLLQARVAVTRRSVIERVFAGAVDPLATVDWTLAEEGAWLAAHRVLAVGTLGPDGVGTTRLVAVAGDALRLLDREHPGDVAAVLAAEPALERAPPRDLAALLLQALLDGPAEAHHVLEGPGDLAPPGLAGPAPDPAALAACAAPTLARDGDALVLDVVTLSGPPGAEQEVVRRRARLARDGRVTWTATTVCARAFPGGPAGA